MPAVPDFCLEWNMHYAVYLILLFKKKIKLHGNRSTGSTGMSNDVCRSSQWLLKAFQESFPFAEPNIPGLELEYLLISLFVVD